MNMKFTVSWQELLYQYSIHLYKDDLNYAL